MSETLRGTVERVTFFNPDNGFAVLKVDVAGRRNLVAVVGNPCILQPEVSGCIFFINKKGLSFIGFNKFLFQHYLFSICHSISRYFNQINTFWIICNIYMVNYLCRRFISFSNYYLSIGICYFYIKLLFPLAFNDNIDYSITWIGKD